MLYLGIEHSKERFFNEFTLFSNASPNAVLRNGYRSEQNVCYYPT